MTERIFTSVTGDNTLTQRYVDIYCRSEHLEAEKSLLSAILDDAVQEYRKYSEAHNAEGKKRFREARDWIIREGKDWIFSFDTICDILGLDPDYVRRGVLGTDDKIGGESARVMSHQIRHRG